VTSRKLDRFHAECLACDAREQSVIPHPILGAHDRGDRHVRPVQERPRFSKRSMSLWSQPLERPLCVGLVAVVIHGVRGTLEVWPYMAIEGVARSAPDRRTGIRQIWRAGDSIVKAFARSRGKRTEKHDPHDVALRRNEGNNTTPERVSHQNDLVVGPMEIIEHHVLVLGPSSQRVVARKIAANARVAGRCQPIRNRAPAPVAVPSSMNQCKCGHQQNVANSRPPSKSWLVQIFESGRE
jgi:hypothetical protein